MSQPGQYAFRTHQGQTWAIDLVLKNELNVAQDLTGYTARMQVRESIESPVVLLDVSTANARIVITPLLGKLSFLVSAVDMAALPLNNEQANWVYDLELVDAALTPYVTRILEGGFIVTPEVTR